MRAEWRWKNGVCHVRVEFYVLIEVRSQRVNLSLSYCCEVLDRTLQVLLLRIIRSICIIKDKKTVCAL